MICGPEWIRKEADIYEDVPSTSEFKPCLEFPKEMTGITQQYKWWEHIFSWKR